MGSFEPIALFVGIGLSAALLVASCAGPPPPSSVLACPPLHSYSPAEQLALAQALRGLPASSPLVSAMLDYQALRDADRACQTAAGVHQ